MEFSPEFVQDTHSLLRKRFATHHASYRDLAARAVVDQTIFKLISTVIHGAPAHPSDAPPYPSDAPASALKVDDDPICIIGAGAAGLYAAMILQDLGLKYEILEASDRIGGRILTHRFNDEDVGYDAPRNTPERYDYYDIGAMRYPDIPFMKRVFDLFDRINIRDLLIPYTFHHPNNLLYYNLQPPATSQIAAARVDYFRVSELRGGTVPDPYAKEQPDHWLGLIFDPFRRLFEGMNDPDPIKRGLVFQKAWAELSKQDHFSTRGYMLAGKESKPEDAPEPYPESVVHWLETMDSATGLYDQAFVESVMDSLDFDWPFPKGNSCLPSELCPSDDSNDNVVEQRWYCIDGGSDHIVREMEGQLHTKPILNRPVVKIERVDDSHMQVTYLDDNGNEHHRNYPHVISTVPLGCLQTIDTDNAGLLYGQREAIRSLQYDASTKIGIKFEKRWWQDPTVMGEGRTIQGGQSSADIPIRVCVYPSYGLDCPSAPGVLLASYTWAQDARRFGSLAQGQNTAADKDLLKITLNNLEKLHRIPQSKFGKVVDHKTHAWYNDRYSRGAFALFGPGQFGPANDKTSLFASIKAPAADGRFHIAGEATSVHHAWVLGALNSAWRAVYNVLLKQRPDKIPLLIKNWGIPDEESEKGLLQLNALARNHVL
ncbi:hypothetical protein QCA50_018415 [Cerrena zonata]|uniref:Amine oxidase domain-containing protein n=1 Tax=Cerrena zonata TaxID=2478898 RepID=A0AAW0FLT1_9APHY